MPPIRRELLLKVATECLAENLRRATRKVSAYYDDALAETGLRGTQVSLLTAVALVEQMPVARLAGILGLDRTTLTRNLAPLEREGLVALVPSPDKRVRMICLSPKGEKLLERALVGWTAAQKKVSRALGEERAAKLLDGLKAAAALEE